MSVTYYTQIKHKKSMVAVLSNSTNHPHGMETSSILGLSWIQIMCEMLWRII